MHSANVTSNTTWEGRNTTFPATPYPGITSILYLWPQIAVPTLTVGAVIFVVGVTGNAVVVASVLRFRQRGIYFYLLSLSLADLLVLLFGLPLKIAEWFFLEEWIFGTAMCKILAYLQMLSFTASVMTLTATAIERKFVIMNPVKARTQKTKHRACRALVLVWAASLLLSSPVLYAARPTPFDSGDGGVVWHCVHVWPSALYGRLYAVYNAVVLLLVPLCIMTYNYVMSGHEVMTTRKGGHQRSEVCCLVGWMGSRTKRKRSSDSADSGDDGFTAHRRGNPMKVIKLMAGLVVVFTICWAPLLIYNLLIKFAVMSRYTQAAYVLKLALHLLAHSNSCANPVCYAFLSRHFRSSFKRSCRCLPSSLRGKSPTENWRATHRALVRRTLSTSGAWWSRTSILSDRSIELPSDARQSTGHTTASRTNSAACRYRRNNRHSSIKHRTNSVVSTMERIKSPRKVNMQTQLTLHVTLRKSGTSTSPTLLHCSATKTCHVEARTLIENCRQNQSLQFIKRYNPSDSFSVRGIVVKQDQNYEISPDGVPACQSVSRQVPDPKYFDRGVMLSKTVHFETSV